MKHADVLVYPSLIIINIIILYNSFFITDNYLIISFLNLIPKEYIESTITSLFLFPFLNAIPDFFSYVISMEKHNNELSTTINILLGSSSFVFLIGLSIVAYKEPNFILNTRKIRKFSLSILFSMISLLSLFVGICCNFNTLFFVPCCIILYTTIIFLQELSEKETENMQRDHVVEDLERAIHINRGDEIKPENGLWVSITSKLDFLNKSICNFLEYFLYIDLESHSKEESEKKTTSKSKYLKIGVIILALVFGNYLFVEKINLKIAASVTLFIVASLILYITNQENTVTNIWNLLSSIGVLYIYIFVLFYTINKISTGIGFDGKSLVILITSWENGIGDLININSLVGNNITLALYSTINNFLFNYLVVFCLTESIFSVNEEGKLDKESIRGLIMSTSILGICLLTIMGYFLWANWKKVKVNWIFPLGLYLIYITVNLM